jgi:hypothetical protein
MMHLDAEGNGDVVAALLLLASGGLGRRGAWEAVGLGTADLGGGGEW